MGAAPAFPFRSKWGGECGVDWFAYEEELAPLLFKLVSSAVHDMLMFQVLLKSSAPPAVPCDGGSGGGGIDEGAYSWLPLPTALPFPPYRWDGGGGTYWSWLLDPNREGFGVYSADPPPRPGMELLFELEIGSGL